MGIPKPGYIWAALTGLSGLKKKKNHEIGRGAWTALGEVGWEVDEIIIYLYMYDVLTEQINKIKKS